MKHYAAETNYLNVRGLNQKLGVASTNEALKIVADEITKAVQLLPECKNFRIVYLNILERDLNPDGTIAFFRITNYDVEESVGMGDALPEIIRPAIPVVGLTEIGQ